MPLADQALDGRARCQAGALVGVTALFVGFPRRDGIQGAAMDFTSLSVTVGAAATDGGFAVFFEGFKQGFSLIIDVILKTLKTLLETAKMLIKSGMLMSLVNVGIDMTVIYYVEIMLPLLFALIDAIMCLINLFQPDTWTDQLKCAALKCFQGPDMETDLLVMSSVPVVLKRAAAIADAVVNSKTMRAFVKEKPVSSQGRVFDPDKQEYIPAEEPENAQNPRPNFAPFVSMTDHWFTPELDACRNCFVCRVPEIRLIWFFAAQTYMLTSFTNVYKFAGNVTQSCMNNQTGYIELCGPAGAEALGFPAWRAAKERAGGTLGYGPLDPRIPDTYASAMMDRARQTGDIQFLKAAEAWERRDKGADESEQGVDFHFQMCYLMRRTQMHAEHGDGGPMYAEYAEDSKSYLVGKYMYDTCRRWKHVVVGDLGRAFHDGLFEAITCIGNDVVCHKQMRECLGGCGGTDGSVLKHDFHTQVSLADLSEVVLGEEGFSQAAANCTIKTAMVDVPLFEGGDSFKRFAGRLRVRSGMSAISSAWCDSNPLSCGTIQRVLERSPGLIFVGGRFVHRYDAIAPSPPPPPAPPPRTLVYGESPSPPPPPPFAPPPYYAVRAPAISCTSPDGRSHSNYCVRRTSRRENK